MQAVAVAQWIIDAWGRVDVLNSGGGLLSALQTSTHGNEKYYEINTRAPFLLTTRLQPDSVA